MRYVKENVRTNYFSECSFLINSNFFIVMHLSITHVYGR